MLHVDELLKEARQLPREERRKLVDELAASLAQEASEAVPPPADGPYAKTLALAGTGHTDFRDVCSDKYKHLGEIYGDNHEAE
ncbi:MAG: hypothetical protein HY814_15075 [Candidatus Riflebacteria bacterium]|nr:hypothetical protein [Candidatus Riflebacteria bacterium]